MNKFLESFKLKVEHRGIKPFICEFRKGLNVLVGENASGKSTILGLMGKNDPFNKWKGVFSIKLIDTEKNKFRFLDTEKDNPRLKNIESSKNIGYQLASHFASHGEAMLPLIKTCKYFKNEIIFIDEPEAGISLKNQKAILRALKASVKNGCQVIITTHSYVLIKGVKEVFSLDKKKWVSSQEYLKENLK